MTPLRVQRKRSPGAKLPSNTVVCTRPGFWGNEFSQPTPADNVRLYGMWLRGPTLSAEAHRLRFHELRGKNLACYCALCEMHKDGKPLDLECPDCAVCHVDELGKLVMEINGQQKTPPEGGA